MRKWVLALFLFFTLLLPLSAGAQDPLTLSSLQVQIWPEYDRHSVLVIYNMFLPAETTYPASLSMHIPIAAGEPNAVAARQVDGSLYTMDYTRQVAGDWATISFTTTASEIQLEYYDPSLGKADNSRHYQYTWSGDYAVTQFIIQVQQPAEATDMRISPSLGEGAAGNDNLLYFTQNIGAIPAGQNITITVDYQKTSDSLSVETLPVQPSAPIPESSTPDLNVATWLPWILGIAGAGLIIGGIIWFWHTGRQKPAPTVRHRRARPGPSESENTQSQTVEAIYCSQCGQRASPGDQFCRYCGSQIRPK